MMKKYAEVFMIPVYFIALSTLFVFALKPKTHTNNTVELKKYESIETRSIAGKRIK